MTKMIHVLFDCTGLVVLVGRQPLQFFFEVVMVRIDVSSDLFEILKDKVLGQFLSLLES